MKRSISPLGAFMLCIAAFAGGLEVREIMPRRRLRTCAVQITTYTVVPGQGLRFSGRQGRWHVIESVRVGPGPTGVEIEIGRCVPDETRDQDPSGW